MKGRGSGVSSICFAKSSILKTLCSRELIMLQSEQRLTVPYDIVIGSMGRSRERKTYDASRLANGCAEQTSRQGKDRCDISRGTCTS